MKISCPLESRKRLRRLASVQGGWLWNRGRLVVGVFGSAPDRARSCSPLNHSHLPRRLIFPARFCFASLPSRSDSTLLTRRVYFTCAYDFVQSVKLHPDIFRTLKKDPALACFPPSPWKWKNNAFSSEAPDHNWIELGIPVTYRSYRPPRTASIYTIFSHLLSSGSKNVSLQINNGLLVIIKENSAACRIKITY